MTTETKTKSGRRYARPKSGIATENNDVKPKTENDSSVPAVSPRETKIAKVIALLLRDEGATLDEIITATGWLPHTARAAMTGFRKKGHTFERSKRGETTCYHIMSSADA